MRRTYIPLAIILAALFEQAQAADLVVTKTVERSEITPPSVCFLFNDLMQGSKSESNLEGFIELYSGKKELTAVPSLNDNALCLNSLKHGTTYTAILKKGLASKNNLKLPSDVKKTFTLAKAPSSLTLEKGNVTTLSDPTITLNTVNLKSVKLYLYKLSLSDLNALDLYRYSVENISRYEIADLIKNHGILVLEKELRLNGQDNEKLQSTINISTLTKDLDKSGLYLTVAAQQDFDIDDQNDLFNNDLLYQGKIIAVSDLGLSVYKGSDGLYAAIKSFKDAKPIKDANLTLLSRNNTALYETKTDHEGFAFIPRNYLNGKNADAPLALIAAKRNDVFAVDLRKSPLFLEGNDGQDVSALPYNCYSFTDRGIYRPGENVHFNAIIRDEHFKALQGKTFTLKVINSRGVNVENIVLKDQGVGYYSYDYQLPSEASRGLWTFKLYSGNKLLKNLSINVNEFVPNLITAKFTDVPQKAGINKNTVKINASYNYGSAAEDLKLYPSIYYSVDNHPFAAFKDYHFSIDAKDSPNFTRFNNLPKSITDEKGNASFKIGVYDNNVPQKAAVSVNLIAPNNQNITLNNEVKIDFSHNIIGIKETQLNADEKNLAFVLCSKEGSSVIGSGSYTLYKENIDYQYVFADNRWQFKQIVSKTPVSSGKLDFKDTSNPLNLNVKLNDGSYLIEAQTDGVLTSLRFYQGYSSYLTPESPERFVLSSDKKQYQKGDNVTLNFESPYSGSAVLALGSKSVSKLQNIEVKKGHNSFTFKLSDDFYPGTHALLTVFSVDKNQNPRRAIGLNYLQFKPDDSIIKISSEFKQNEIKPNSCLSIPLNLEGADNNTLIKAYLVDEGILNLTGFKDIKPESMFDKPRLSYEIFDSYGNIIKKIQKNNQGYGDEAMAEASLLQSLSTVPHKTVALESKVIKVNNGQAQIDFDVPNFSGALHLMAFAWNNDKVGSLSSIFTVKDKAVTDLTLPYYLIKGDKSDVKLTINNLEVAHEKFNLKISCSGSVACSLDKTISAPLNTLSKITLPLNAAALGQGKVDVLVKSDNYSYKETYPIEVISSYPNSLEKHSSYVAPDKTVTFKFKEKFNQDAIRSLCTGYLPLINQPAFIKDLDNLSSPSAEERALRLLSRNNLSDDPKINSRIEEDINALCAYLNAAGSFNADAYDYERQQYIDALGAQALLLKNREGFYIQDPIIKIINNNLLRLSRTSQYPAKALAYFVQAQNGNVNLAALRYSFDEDKPQDLLSQSAYIKAFALSGDSDRLNEAINRAKNAAVEFNMLYQKLNGKLKKEEREDILDKLSILDPLSQGRIFLGYSTIEALALSGNFLKINEFIEAFGINVLSDPYLSSLDEASMLIAAKALNLDENSQNNSCKILSAKDNLSYKNNEDKGVYATAAIFGQTENPPADTAYGIKLTKTLYDERGKILKPPYNVTQNEKIIVKLEIDPQQAAYNRQIILRDLIPSGFIFERELLPNENQYPFIKTSDTYGQSQHSSHELLLNLSGFDNGKIVKAYVLRGAYPGTYILPSCLAYCLNDASLRAAQNNNGEITVHEN